MGERGRAKGPMIMIMTQMRELGCSLLVVLESYSHLLLPRRAIFLHTTTWWLRESSFAEAPSLAAWLILAFMGPQLFLRPACRLLSSHPYPGSSCASEPVTQYSYGVSSVRSTEYRYVLYPVGKGAAYYPRHARLCRCRWDGMGCHICIWDGGKTGPLSGSRAPRSWHSSQVLLCTYIVCNM